MTKKVFTVGHLPPPVTGENICRQRLEDVLCVHGYEVDRNGRGINLRLLGTCAEKIVIVCRQSFLGSVSDLLISIYFLTRGRKVWCYFHNRSWRRYMHFPFTFLLRYSIMGRLRMIVLTRAIERKLNYCSYNAGVLNNTGGLEFDSLSLKCCGTKVRRLIWVGRVDNAKGFALAIEVFKKLCARESGWRFDVYGSLGREVEKVPFLNYHGFVSGDEKIEAFKAGGIMILPSCYINETQPLSIIEAMAAGLPVVASSAGDIPFMLGDGAGVSVDVLSVDAYFNAVRHCYFHYEEISERARMRYRKYYSYDAFRQSVIVEFGD